MNIAVIPARGGSKRIPRKNIKLFNGRPIILFSIDACRESGLFDRIIVSSDDAEIKQLALNYGVEVHHREDSLSDDSTPIVPVIKDVLESLANIEEISYVCCIFACAPLIEINDLRRAYNKIENSDEKFVYPVLEFVHPIQRALALIEDKPVFRESEFELSRTQDLNVYYHDAGQFYFGKTSAWLQGGKMHTDGVAIKMPSWRVVDIDTEEDWSRAEFLQSYLLQKKALK